MKMDDVQSIRVKIDEIDEKILNLLNERSEVVLDMAEVKRNKNIDFYSPEREKEILDRLSGKNTGYFPNEALRNIFKEIFCACLSLEEPPTIAYLGPEATFTHLAAIRYFGSTCTLHSSNSIKGVFETVEFDEASFGVVPIENSNEGVINYTLDMFVDYNLTIFAEILLEISHNLISKSKDISEVKEIYSHPQPAAQCRVWLERNMFGIPIYDSPSTAEAASIVAKKDGSAAIASELAAKLHDLNFIARHIEDNKSNITRFLVIAKKSQQRSGDDKTSILFTLKDEPGSLYKVLTPIKKAKINMTEIESRPSKRKAWEYIFFVDLEGHMEDRKVKKALAEVKKRSLYLRILGSYPHMEDKV